MITFENICTAIIDRHAPMKYLCTNHKMQTQEHGIKIRVKILKTWLAIENREI